MTETTFRVVFRGGLTPGAEQEAVRASLTRQFRMSAAASAALFSGRTVVVSRSASAPEAARLEAQFRRLGAVVVREPLGEAPPPPPPPVAAAPPRPPEPALPSPTVALQAPVAIVCPKCGRPQAGGAEACSACGVQMRRFAAAALRALDPLQLLRDQLAASRARLSSERLFVAPEIPAEVLSAAVAAHHDAKATWIAWSGSGEPPLRGMDEDEEILLVYANNIASARAESNVVLTDRRIYYSITVLGAVCSALPWNDLRAVTADESRTNLGLNGREIVLCGRAEDAPSRAELVRILQEVARAPQTRAQVKAPVEVLRALAGDLGASPHGSARGPAARAVGPAAPPAAAAPPSAVPTGRVMAAAVPLPVPVEPKQADFFAAEKKGVEKGVAGGAAMMAIAVVWFVLGLMADRIFFYPPVLFVIGLYGFIKGLVSGNIAGEG